MQMRDLSLDLGWSRVWVADGLVPLRMLPNFQFSLCFAEERELCVIANHFLEVISLLTFFVFKVTPINNSCIFIRCGIEVHCVPAWQL